MESKKEHGASVKCCICGDRVTGKDAHIVNEKFYCTDCKPGVRL